MKLSISLPFLLIQVIFPSVWGLPPGDYTVPTGLTVSEAVAPGLLKYPMMATLDDSGRLFVAESSGVNLDKEQLLKTKPHSIKLLTDTDRDGIYDKVTTFADQMVFPQGALWVYDSLYVMDPPGMWNLTDADGDGVAESRELIVSGFDFTGNAADVHGPFLHPNGRLYWCHGRKGHEVKDSKTGVLVSKAMGARIWSCQLDGSDVRVHAGGGLDNPVEIDFTVTGEIIGTANIFHGKPRGDCLVHWLHGGAYPRSDQEKVLGEFKRTGPLLEEIHNFGHVAVSGICRYRSGHLNRDWKDQWLVAHFNSNQVTRTRLEKKGSTFAAAETDTVFQLNRANAHLTDVLEDHNGDLLVIDTGGWFRQGCPTSQIARPDVNGGIYRIAKSGTPYQPSKSMSAEVWGKFDPIQVAEFLKSDDCFVQERAVTEFAIRGESALAEIELIFEDPKSTEDARRNAVWALARMRFSESPDIIARALQDPAPTVQITACNAISVTRTWQQLAKQETGDLLFELDRNKTISGTLAKMVRTSEPEIARNAAVALGAMGETRAVGSLFGRAGREGGSDRALEHAIIYSLIEIADSDAVLATLRSGNTAQQNVAIWALEGMDNFRLGILDLVLYFHSDDDTLRKTVTEIAKRHPEWDAAIANQFYFFTDELTPQKEAQILDLAPHFANTPPILSFVGYLLHHDDPKVENLARRLLPTFPAYDFQADWQVPFQRWLSDPATIEIALNSLSKTSSNLFDKELAAIAEDKKYSPIIRVKALRAKSTKGKNNAISGSAFALLLEILEQGKDAALRSQAIQILETSSISSKELTEIARLLDRADPVELPRLFKLFRSVPDPEQAKVLSETLPKSPGFGGLNMGEVRGLFSGFDTGTREVIYQAIAKVEQEHLKRKDNLLSLVADFEKGDPVRGRKHFESGKGACITCHKIGDLGKAVGPDLSTIARVRKPVDLVESILYPSESIARDFESFIVTLNDDSQHLGIIPSETETSITLTGVAGLVEHLDRKQIKTIQRNPASLMPVGLDQSMTRDELLDLVSFLMTLK